MTEAIGAIHVDVLPRADDFVSSLRARILPDMGRLGNEAGTEFVRQFRTPVESGLAEVFSRTRPRTNEQSRQSGRQAGDAFGRELDTRITAAIAALPDITVDGDTTDVELKLATIRQQLTELSHKKLGVDITDAEALAGLETLRAQLDELTKPEHDVRVRINAGAAEAELAAIRAQIEGLDEVGTAEKKATESAGLLKLALLTLGPAIVPLAAGGAAAFVGLAGGAASVLLAVKGVNAEIKAGTPLGQQWEAQLHSLTGTLGVLETTASRSFLSAAGGAGAQLRGALPSLSGDISRIGTVTGDIADHAIGALIAGFRTLDPLIEQVLGMFDQGAAKLEMWAQGGGLQKFVDFARANLPEMAHDLAAIGELVVKVLAATAPAGLTSLNLLGNLSTVAAHLLPVLGPLAPEIIAVYTAIMLYRNLGPAIASLRAFAAAQAATAETSAAAGAASGIRGASGSMALFAARAVPYVAAAVGMALAFSSADKATRQWALSTSGLERGIHNWAGTVDSVLHGNLGKAWDDLTDKSFQSHKKMVGQIDETIALRDQELGTILAYNKAVADTEGTGFRITRPELQPVLTRPDTAALDEFNTAKAQAYSDTVANIGKSFAVLKSQVAATPLSQVNEQLNQLQTSVQSNVDSTGKFLDLGGKTVLTYRGLAIGENAWAAAMSQSNGDSIQALASVEGLADGYLLNQQRVKGLAEEQQRLGTFQADVSAKFGLTASQVDLYSAALGISADKLDKNDVSMLEAEQALGDFVGQLKNGSTATDQWVQAIDQFNKAGDTAASRGALIGAALRAANGDAIGFGNTMVQVAVANQQFVKDMVNAKAGVIDWSTGVIDFHNAAAAPLLQDLQQLQDGAVASAGAVYQHEAAMHKASAADDAFATYVADTRGALLDQYQQMGITRGQAEKLADQYFQIKNSGDLKKAVELIGKDQVAAAIGQLTRQIAAFGKLIANAFVGLRGAPQASDSLDVLNAKIALFEGTHTATFVTGDGSSGSGGKTIRKADGGIVEHYAAGGMREDHQPFIYKAQPGTVRVFAEPETSWEAYIPGANDWRRPRAKTIAAETVKRLGGVATFESGGFTGVDFTSTAQAAAAKKAASAAKSNTAKLAATANILVTIDDIDITRFLRSLNGSASSIQSAEAALVKAVTSAGGGDQLAAQLTAQDRALVGLADRRAALATKLAAANTKLIAAQKQFNDEQSKVSAAITGAFDITSAGYSPEQILATLAGDQSQATLFSQQLAQVRASGLNKNLIAQITEKGLSAEPELRALSRASKSQIAQINTGVAGLGAIGGDIGHQTAESLYGAGLFAAKGLVAGLKSQEASLAEQMRRLADIMVSEIRKQLKIHSPSQVTRELGGFVGQGMALGIADSHDAVRSAAAKLAGAAVPSVGAAGGMVSHNHDWHLTTTDPVSTAAAVERRLTMLGA